MTAKKDTHVNDLLKQLSAHQLSNAGLLINWYILWDSLFDIFAKLQSQFSSVV